MFIASWIHTRGLLLALLAIGRATSASLTDETPQDGPTTVSLGYATYQGSTYLDPLTSNGNTQFLGIRFAAPPTGSLRFAAPQSPAATPGVQKADQQPKACYQSGFGQSLKSPWRQEDSKLASRQESDQTTEDCLFLNVYVPGNVSHPQKLPVIVWIHGGGYLFGNAAAAYFGEEGFNGNALIRASNGSAIIVVLQYRLGLFGFLAGQKVKEGGALNAGLLDQQFALQWIQSHINKFGGDPQHVSIWGESAGAGSVLQHVVANGGKTSPPLFKNAIANSVFYPPQYKYNDPIPEALFKQIATSSHCADAKDTLQCLREADVKDLDAVNNAINTAGFYGTFPTTPVVDGSFITDQPSVLLKEGRVNGDNFLEVTNLNEGTIFVNQTTPVISPVTTAHYVTGLFPKLNDSQVTAVANIYSSLGNVSEQATKIMADAVFLCPSYKILKAFEQRKSAYKAEFAISPSLHGDDVIYYFPSSVKETPFNNQLFIEAFSQAFTNFATTDDPNKKWDESNITPVWKVWTCTEKSEMRFGKTDGNAPDIRLITTSEDLLKRCEFWDSISASTAI